VRHARPDIQNARVKVDPNNDALATGPDMGSVTVGLALLRPEDTVEAVAERADQSMYERRRLNRHLDA
jgi:PleD family two-component response regulator